MSFTSFYIKHLCDKLVFKFTLLFKISCSFSSLFLSFTCYFYIQIENAIKFEQLISDMCTVGTAIYYLSVLLNIHLSFVLMLFFTQ